MSPLLKCNHCHGDVYYRTPPNNAWVRGASVGTRCDECQELVCQNCVYFFRFSPDNYYEICLSCDGKD